MFSKIEVLGDVQISKSGNIAHFGETGLNIGTKFYRNISEFD